MHLPDESWRRVPAVHLDSTFFCSGEALKLMAAREGGCIINMGSIAWAAVYLASDEARFVTGQVLSPNGGWHMSQ